MFKPKKLTYEEAVAREKARADADEDYIMKIFDPENAALLFKNTENGAHFASFAKI